MIIEHDHIEMDPIKLRGIKEWQSPGETKRVKDIRAFLGFCNFYRKFIANFADLAKPLTELTKKDDQWHWGKEQEQAFNALKDQFLKAPILQMPDDSKQCWIDCNASLYTTAAVLKQQDNNGDWKPCGYISHRFNSAERNYQIYDRELLAILNVLREWRYLCEGSKYPVIIHSNHNNLRFYRTPQQLTRRQARWHEELGRYTLEIHHIPGKKLIDADMLSRASQHNAKEIDNEDITMLPKHWLKETEESISLIDTSLCKEMLQ